MTRRVSTTFSLVFLLCFLSWSLFNSLNAAFWAYFMTEVAGISAVAMGVVLVIAHGLDWLLAPVAGVMIERSQPRWGRYRSWLLLGPPVVFVLLVLIFIDLPLPVSVKPFVFALAYILAALLIGLTMVSLTTLPAAMNLAPRDRVILSARKGQGSSLAKILFGMTALPLILWVNGGEKSAAAGYIAASLSFGLLFVLSFWSLFRLSAGPEHGLTSTAAPMTERVSLAEMVRLLATNKPLIVLVFAEASRYTAQWVLMGMSIYYFQYAFDDLAMMAVMLTSMNIVGLAGSVAVEYVTRYIDKRVAYVAGMGMMAICLAATWLLARDAVTFTTLISLGWLGFSFMNGTQLALQADCVLYSEYQHGRSAKAFLMSSFQWCPKIAGLIAGAVIGFGLTAIGYSSGVEGTPELVAGMNNLITLVPLAVLVAGLVAMIGWYRLDTSQMRAAG